MALEDSDRDLIRVVVEGQQVTQSHLLNLGNTLGSMHERLDGFIDRADRRFDEHAEQIAKAADDIASLKKQAHGAKLWAMGAGATLTAILATATWVAANVPSKAWALLTGHK